MAVEVSSEMKRVHALVHKFGPSYVAASMGLEEELLFALMSGQAVWDENVVDRLSAVCNSVSDVVDWSVGERAAVFVSGGDLEDVEEAGAAGFPVEYGEAPGYEGGDPVDLDGPGVRVTEGLCHNPVVGAVSELSEFVRESGVSVLSPGATAAEQFERRLENLWAARDLAIMTQFAIGVEDGDILYALGLVNEIELALIMMFRQEVPRGGRRWDEYRRQKEIYVRMVRKNRIQRNLKKERSGWRGLVSKVKGEKPMSARDMFNRLMVYVDDMEAVMDEERLSERLLRGVRDFVGGV